MPSLSRTSLVLFFTNNVSLRTWADAGILEREVEIYRRLLPHVGRITFVTYGDSRELQYAKQLGGIRVLFNRWGLPAHWYARLIPLLHMPRLLKADILKTNQASGARAALPVRRWLHKKLIARCGYMWSLNTARKYGKHTEVARRAYREEQRAFRIADRVVVTTPAMRDYTVESHGIDAGKVAVIPNYVDVELFSPEGEEVRDNDTIIFIGRLVEEKNIGALIEAVSNLNVRLMIIGDGPLRSELEAKAAKARADILFLGRIPYSDLPGYIRRSTLFVLPSLWEGQPKALLEAMACGVPVAGGDSPGIRELVTHGETGYLCETSASGIRDAITSLLADESLRKRLGANGREFVVQNFSLERVVDMELGLYASLVQ